MVVLGENLYVSPQARIARRRREKKMRSESTKCILAIGNHHLGLVIFKIFAAARRLSIEVDYSSLPAKSL